MLRSTAAALRRLIPPLIQRRCILRRQVQDAFHPTANRILFLKRGYAKMAKRIPPFRPDNYSESESESEKEENEEEMEERGDESAEWEGFTLDFGSGSENDPAEGEEE